MRYALVSLLIVLLIKEPLFAQDPITEIRRLYKETQANKSSYTTKSADDFENSSEGGQIVAYLSDNDVRLIEATYYGHMGKARYEFYFTENSTYFIFVQEHNYNAPPTVAEYDESKTTVDENRYYFWNDSMIRWIKPDGSLVASNSEEFKKEGQKQLEWAKEVNGKF